MFIYDQRNILVCITQDITQPSATDPKQQFTSQTQAGKNHDNIGFVAPVSVCKYLFLKAWIAGSHG